MKKKQKKQSNRLNKDKLITRILFSIEKILSRCPYFFRLDNILGDRPNVRPPVFFDSGSEVRATGGALDTLLEAIGPAKEIGASEREIREMACERRRGQREVSVPIQEPENLRGWGDRGNEPCGVIERGGKERYSGRRECNESVETIARERGDRVLEEEQLAQEELGYEEGGRREEIGEGSRDEIGGGNLTPVGPRRVREVSEMGGGRIIGMKSEGKVRSL